MIVKELFARLGLDVDTTGFDKAAALMGGTKGALMALGAGLAAVAVGITAMVVETANAGREAYLLAQKTGQTTDAVQELSYAAQAVGLSSEEAGVGLIHLTRHMQAAKQGSDEQAKAFAQIGVKVTDASGHLRDASDVMEDIAEHFATMPDGADKTALALQLFGKSGAEMIPMLNKGRAGLDELRAQAHELGLVLDQDAIDKSNEFKTSLLQLKLAGQALTYAVGTELMPLFKDAAQAVVEWMRANRELNKQRLDKLFGLFRIALAVVLPPLKLVGTLLGLILDNWRLIAVVLSSVVFAALVVNAAQVMAIAWGYVTAGAAGVASGLATAAAWVAANLPLIAMTLIFAAIILILDDVATAMRGGHSVLKEWLGEWKDDSPGDAWWLRDLKALAYFMLHMGPVFDFWKEKVKALWEWMKQGFIDTWDDIVVGVKEFFGIHDDRNAAKLRKKAHYGMGYQTDKSDTLGPGEWKANSQGEQLWYPFSDVDDAANAQAVGLRKSGSGNTFSVIQNIHPPQGANAQDVADMSANELDKWHQSQLAAADAGL